MTAFDQAFEAVKNLAATFKANEARYLSSEYQEAEARKDFIDKFFIALGWDVNHDRQTNPYAQEVKVERASGGPSQRRADYAFYLEPNFRDVRFYVEAKKPQRDIATADNYFQTIRYASGSRTPLAALTDFEQFQVLDCRFKADIKGVLKRCVRSYHYRDYSDRDKFSEIYWLFSHEAIAGGSLENFAAMLPKRGKGIPPPHLQNIDDAFLDELEGYRASLARAFKNKNPHLDSPTLTEVTQRTLDRLVFMRFLEDKLIEPKGLVARFTDKNSAGRDFVAASRRLDNIYNGIVFKQHPILDAHDFRVDNAALSEICKHLSDEHSPYDFNAIPIHILGSIYERFLGKVIIATDKRVRVEDKPEVRKAGGVYYTPGYIVRYIVENTVGKLIADKTPNEIAVMRFGDIACGSGSFLLGVYDLLLSYHGTYYNENRSKAQEGDCIERDGKLYLSLQKRREILLNNIYGVDIDAQAVEVCQLSLYLKLLEDETTETARQYVLEFQHTAQLKKLLPDLSRKIVCGNSLIATDILEGQLFPDAEERKLNPMNFEDAFPEIMKRGGFDAIVGNPPYVRIQGFPRQQIDYLTRHYRSATGNCDLYVSFVERSYTLLRQGGSLGYIVPNKFLKTDYGVGLRNLVASEKALSQVINFGASQVFDATIYTCLLFLQMTSHDSFGYAEADANPRALSAVKLVVQSSGSLGPDAWLFADEATADLVKKLSINSRRLLDLPADMSRGSSTGDDSVFVLSSSAKIEKEVLRVPLFATDFNRYTFSPSAKWRVIFPYKVGSDDSRALTQQELKQNFPKAYAYLKSKQALLKNRKQYAEWFAYSAPRNLLLHNRAQIAVPLLADRGLFALIPEETRGKMCPMASGGFTITLSPSCPLRPEYVLALLNSRVLFWMLRQLSNVFRGGWITCTKQYFGGLPIARPNKGQHDAIVQKVDAMLDAKKQVANAKTDKDKTYYENKCAALDRQIDRLVYDLYGLTEDEIRIVEGGK